MEGVESHTDDVDEEGVMGDEEREGTGEKGWGVVVAGMGARRGWRKAFEFLFAKEAWERREGAG